jgi:16S rRNA (uracil1498-N3)-methyltransferase
MARRRFFVDSFQDGFAVLSGADAEHLSRVLRAQPGQLVELSDDRAVYLAEIVEAGRKHVRFRLLEPLIPEAPPLSVTLFASLIRFERFEWMIEKATELGVAAIQPVAAERSETGLLAGAGRRIERWRRIARESAQQARRATLPEILEPARLDRIACGSFTWRFLLDESPQAPPLARIIPAAGSAAESVALLIGPEGGWSDAERARLLPLWTAVSLGNRILRAETAAVAALAVLTNLRF